MSILTAIGRAAEEIGISTPTTIINVSDKDSKQLLQIAHAIARNIADRMNWEALLKTFTFTLDTQEDQGHIDDLLMTDDFDYIINGTFLNDSTTLPINGPINSRLWQHLKSFPVTGPYQQYRFQGKHLLIDPVPGSGETARFEYKSNHIAIDTVGTTKARFTLDTDEFLLDEKILTRGIIYRWNQRHGLEYGEDFNDYERLVLNAMGRDGGNKTLNAGATAGEVQPGIFVPIGNWNGA